MSSKNNVSAFCFFLEEQKTEIIYAFFFCSCLQRFLHTTTQKWILMLWVSDSIIKVVRHYIIICRSMSWMNAGATLSQQFYDCLSLLDFGIPQSPQNRGHKNSKSIWRKIIQFLEFEILQIFLVKINWLFTEIKTNIAIWRIFFFNS